MKYEAPICEWFELKATDIICESVVEGVVGGLTALPEEGTDTSGVDTNLN